MPNPNYYGPIPQLQKVVYLFYKDADTVYKAYQDSQIDFARLSSGQLAEARKLSNEYHVPPVVDQLLRDELSGQAL